MTVLDLAQNRISGLKKKTAKEWAGPCPVCGGTDRFLVWTHRDAWHCRGCDKSGDAIEFLRMVDGLSCPDAHEALGKPCDSSSCGARDKCRLGDGKTGATRRDPLRVTPSVKPERTDDWTPSTATDPAAQWAEKAEALTTWAHEQLLANADQLAFLAARGLPIEAVKQFRLGWVPKDLYRERGAWGLSTDEISERTGKPKKLWIPQGILIPFTADAQLHRIRIRRHKVEGDQPRYYWLPGSGNDVVLINPTARAFVVVESDLDGLAVVHAASDLVGSVPLGTCSAKPKEHANEILSRALSILVALDFDSPDAKGQRPGSKAWPWWREHFPRADRWPVPAGKDPGDYVKDHGGDLRAWVEAGLRKFCPALTIQPPPTATNHVEKPEEAAADHLTDDEPVTLPTHHKGISAGGHDYIIAHQADHAPMLMDAYPGVPVFTLAEIEQLKGMTKQQAEIVLLAKKALGADTEVLETRPLKKTEPQ